MQEHEHIKHQQHKLMLQYKLQVINKSTDSIFLVLGFRDHWASFKAQNQRHQTNISGKTIDKQIKALGYFFSSLFYVLEVGDSLNVVLYGIPIYYLQIFEHLERL